MASPPNFPNKSASDFLNHRTHNNPGGVIYARVPPPQPRAEQQQPNVVHEIVSRSLPTTPAPSQSHSAQQPLWFMRFALPINQ